VPAHASVLGTAACALLLAVGFAVARVAFPALISQLTLAVRGGGGRTLPRTAAALRQRRRGSSAWRRLPPCSLQGAGLQSSTLAPLPPSRAAPQRMTMMDGFDDALLRFTHACPAALHRARGDLHTARACHAHWLARNYVYGSGGGTRAFSSVNCGGGPTVCGKDVYLLPA